MFPSIQPCPYVMDCEGKAVKFTCKMEYSTIIEAIITGDDSKVCSEGTSNKVL